MDNKIIEAKDLPEEEKVFLKKDFLGWRVVDPINNSDGTTNWKKALIGSKRMWFSLIILLVIAALLYLGIKSMIDPLRIIADNPTAYCESVAKSISMNLSSYINISK